MWDSLREIWGSGRMKTVYMNVVEIVKRCQKRDVIFFSFSRACRIIWGRRNSQNKADGTHDEGTRMVDRGSEIVDIDGMKFERR